ncbi:MAG: hypothetical protein COA91_13960 [Robiginitomaculum sp.]|nr:MAG: hypothetical protein COA91_13960 [Robiginitomaculum sp.]
MPGTRYETVLDYVQDGTGVQIVDFSVSDDTQVDFAAIAICQKPPRGKGVTYFNGRSTFNHLPAGVHAVSCSRNKIYQSVNCNLFKGDTACDTPLPLVCFHDLGLPVPDKFAVGTPFWSGGNVALTRKRRGDNFKTIAEAHAFCRLEFGAEWRVASFHDSSRGVITSSVPVSGPKGSAWVDIKDQPYATCWARGEER